jgi:hypothetical protein
MAVPLFIYAATMCLFVGTKGSNPKKNLNRVLEYPKSSFSQLEKTYLPVLDQLLDAQEKDQKEDWLHAFQDVVGSIVLLESPLSITSLASLLRVPQEDIKDQLSFLHSVLSIPKSKDIPVRLLHLSFREFLVNPQEQEKTRFWVDEKSIHKKLASCCLKLMSGPSGLCRDMCSVSELGVLRTEIDAGTVASSLPSELRYACRYWVDHLKQSGQGIVDGDATHLFLRQHLLHWLEAMSLVRESSRCVNLLESLQALASVRSSQNTLVLY